MTIESSETLLVQRVLACKLSVFFDQRAKRAGQKWIIFKRHGHPLAEFNTTGEAMQWLPKINHRSCDN